MTGTPIQELFVSLKLKDEMSGPLDTAAQKTVGVGQKMRDLAPAAMAAGAALTGIGAVATSLIDGNRQMEASFKTMALSFDAPAASVKELARSMQSVDSPIEEVVASMDLLARSGLSLDWIDVVAPAFDTLADATGNTADGMTGALIPAFNALGIPLESAADHVDGLAVMFRKSNVDLGDFSTMMSRMGPDLGEMGLGLTDVEAILMSFAEKGITGRKATSELSQAIKDSDGNISKFYQSLGMSTTELSGYKTELANSAGAAEKFAEAQNSSFGVMDKIGFEFTKLKQSAGDLLAPFEGVATAALALGPAIGGLGGIMSTDLLGSVKSVVGGLSGSGGLLGALGSGGGLMGVVSGAGGAIAAFATGPIGLALIAVAAIAAGVVLLDQKFHFLGPTVEWLGDIFEGIGKWLGDTFGPIIDGVIGFVGELFDTMDDGKDPIEDILGLFKDLGTWVAAAGKAFGDELGPAIKETASWIGQNLGPALKDAFGVIKDMAVYIVGTYVRNIKTTVGALGDLWEMLGKGKAIADPLIATFDAIAKAVGLAQTGLTMFSNWLDTNFGPALGAAAKALEPLKPLIDGIASAISTINPALGFLATAFGTSGEKAGGANEPISRYGDHVKTAGANAATATPQVSGTGAAIETTGTQAATANPLIDGTASSLTNAGKAGDVAATGINNATGALKTWIVTAASSPAAAAAGAAVGPPPSPTDYSNPADYMAAMKAWTEKYQASLKANTPPAPQTPATGTPVTPTTGTPVTPPTLYGGGPVGTPGNPGDGGATYGPPAGTDPNKPPLFSDYANMENGVALYHEARKAWEARQAQTPATNRATQPASAGNLKTVPQPTPAPAPSEKTIADMIARLGAATANQLVTIHLQSDIPFVARRIDALNQSRNAAAGYRSNV